MAMTRIKKYTFFVGTDVSRETLDHAVMQGTQLLFHQQIRNEPAEIKNFVADLKKIPGFRLVKTVFGMENTGYYCNPLLTTLQKVKADIVVEGAKKIRNTLGNIRGKNDKVDAIRIAEYLYQCRDNLKIWQAKRPLIQQLANLNTLRDRLIGIQGMLKTPLKEQIGFVQQNIADKSVALNSRSIEALSADIKATEQTIATLIDNDERLKRLMLIITSVNSVGPVTALNILICTNEFLHIQDPKKFACYAGVAPFLNESGKFKGRAKVSHMANKKMKTLLHLCAFNAKRNDPELRSYFERKTQVEGKNKMSVLNAIRYKIILRIFACVAQNRLYVKEYTR